MTAESPCLVTCSGVSRTYGSSVQALIDVSCVVGAGDRIAITGPSGSGKSTLLHLLAGLDAPTSGEIAWPALGTSPAQQPGSLGLILQGPSLIVSLDVAENVTLPLILAGQSETDARPRALAALADVGLAGFECRLPEELSGGQAQRVALARVLAAQPRLIIADEPTGQLDSGNAARVMELLVACAERLGAALVVSTHDPLVAAHLKQQWQVIDGRLNAVEVSG